MAGWAARVEHVEQDFVLLAHARGEAVGRKAPLCRVGGSDEPASAGGTALKAAL